MGYAERDRGEPDEVEAVDFGPLFNDRLRMSTIPIVRIETRCDEAALVVMAEGDDNARNG